MHVLGECSLPDIVCMYVAQTRASPACLLLFQQAHGGSSEQPTANGGNLLDGVQT